MSEKDFKNAAHDLNNILTSLLNNIELLKEKEASKESLHKTLLAIENNTKRAADIVQSFLAKGEAKKQEIEKINLKRTVEEAVDTLMPVNAEVTIEEGDDVYPIVANKTDIFRIILNLVKNGVEAVGKEGKVRIGLNNVLSADKKEFVEISIKDNGKGISKDNLARIFEPGFSTKSKEHVSGFGLSIVKEKVEEYKGTIQVESGGKGTELKIYLPALTKERKDKKHILVAEDNDSVSEVLYELLTSYDYSVTLVSTGADALKVISEQSFDALLIDKKMPVMDGIECIKRLRENSNNIPIILASGSDIDGDDEQIMMLKIDRIIKKPYNFPEILSALQTLLI